ncbi:MAG TPA: hypothetical protein PLO48_14315 [Saprospiraceae bacterium]|nr:hypothetical protein [Saprospiraceae bacterium]
MSVNCHIFILLLICKFILINDVNSQSDTILPKVLQLSQLFENEEPKKYEQRITCKLPTENQVVHYKNIYLTWENPCGDISKFQMAEDSDFQKVLIDTMLNNNSLTISELARHREYHWRVSNVSGQQIGTFSESFFKTSSIQLDEYYNQNSVEFIPTWIGNNEILYVSNPEKIDCKIKIFDEKETMISQKCIKQEKFAFRTESWPRGMYKLILSFPDDSSHIKYFVLK